METTKTNTITTNLLEISRRNSSRNGNPAWTLHTSDGTFATGTDASVSYGIENLFGYDPVGAKRAQREGLTLHLTKAGRVIGITLANGERI